MKPTIASITYRPVADPAPLPSVGYRRVALAEATLLEGQGIDQDGKALPRRNLNLMDAPTLAELAAEGFPTTPGALGENIVLADLDLRTLAIGTQLQLGEHVVVALVEPRTGCVKLQRIDERMPVEVQGRVGMMAQVVTGGTIRVGDPVTILHPAPRAERPVLEATPR